MPTTPREAELIAFDYIESFFNSVRRHSSLGYISPVAFETKQRSKNIDQAAWLAVHFFEPSPVLGSDPSAPPGIHHN